MKITRHKVSELAIPEASLSLHDRRQSEEYYKDTKGWGRTDICCIQFRDICNFFYGVDGFIQVDWFDQQCFRDDFTECDEEAKQELRKRADAVFATIDKTFLDENRACFLKWGLKHF